MQNPFDEVRAAVQQAKELHRAVDAEANALADLLEGRLKHVTHYRLKRMKATLQRFNSQTGTWKE